MKRRKTIKWKTGCKKVLATMVAVSMFLTSSVGFAPEAVSAAVKTEATSAEEDANTTLEVTSELSTEDSTSDTTEASEATTAEQVTEETDGNGTYTVTLEDLNHGSILFYDKATKQTEKETSKSFDEGDSVLVQFKPDVGYTVKSFYISDTNGEKLYEKETSDDQFTFTMPAMDLMIGGTVQEEDVSIDTEASEGLQVYGNPYAEDPWYLEGMKEYLASKGMSKNDDAKIDYGAGTACATLVSQAFNYAYKQEYGKDFGFHNINSSTNLFKDLMASDLGFESIYNGEVYNSAKKLVLQPGDILLFNMHYTAFNSSGNITNNEDFDHACFVYDVDEDANKIWIANHRGESSHEAYIKNFNRVVYYLTNQSNPAVYKRMLTKTEAENYEKTGKLEEDSDEISLEEISLDDFNIELEAEQYYDFMTVLRLKKDEDKPGSFKIVKNGNKTSVTRYHYSNGVKDEDNTISLKTLQSKYCSKYGLLSSARFTAYSDSSAKNKAEIYTDAACTKKADASKLIANKTYYVKSVPEAGIKLYVKETKTPKGWSTDTATKTITVKTTGTAKATFTDQFTGDPLNLTLYKEGATGNKLAGAKFKLTRKASGDEDKDQSWTFVTDSDGKIIFDNIAYLYQGAVYLSGNKIRFYAGNYTLEEVTPPSGYKAKGSYTLVDANNTVLQTATAFDGEVFSFKIDSVNGVAQTKIGTVYISNQMKLTASDTPKMIGFKVQKRNLDTGDTTLEGSMTDYTTTFRLIYTGRAGDTDDTYTWYDKNLNGTVDSGEKIHKKDATHSGVVGTFTTNSSGYFELSGKSLQAGTYQIQETNAPSGMLKSTAAQLAGQSILGNSVINFPADWTASTDGHVYDLTGQAKALKNPAARGGVAAYKYDADTLYPAPQSGSSFNGISFYVRNDNANPVYLDTDGDGIGNTKLDAGSSVKIGDITDAMPYAWTNATFLPVGNYTLYETLGNNTSYTASVYAQSFTIDTDGKYILMAKEEHKEALIQFLNQQLAVQIQYLGILGRSVTYQTLGPTKIISNRASRHGLAITKYDADDRTRNPQGNATLIGATYEIYNKNSGAIMVDTNGDGTGDTSVAQNGLCATITTMIDPATGFEYASTNPTLLPNGTYLIKEKTAPTGYEKTASRASGNNGSVEITYRATGDNQYHLFTTTEAEANTLKNVITALYPGHTFDWQVHAGTYMSNPVKRGKLSLKKNDADKKSHKMTGTIASASSDYGTVSNDNESKYAQGDASFENAVYDIYNVSDGYVYTTGSNAATAFSKVASGKSTFKSLTKLDVSTLTYTNGIYKGDLTSVITDEVAGKIRQQMASNLCYTLTTDKKGEASTSNDALPYGIYLVLERTPSTGYLNSTENGGVTAKLVKITSEGDNVSLAYDATDTEKGLYEPIIRGGFEVYKYDEDSMMNIPQGDAKDLSAEYEVINRSKDYVWVDKNGNGKFDDNECYAPGAVVFTFKTDAETGKYTSKKNLLSYGTYEIRETKAPSAYQNASKKNPNKSVFIEIRTKDKIVNTGWYYDKDGNKVTTKTYFAPVSSLYDKNGNPISDEDLYKTINSVSNAKLLVSNTVKRGKLKIKKNDAERKEHQMNGVIASAESDYGTVSNDYESKYAQGDASFEKAVYEIYNISTHYVYTAGSNAGATYKRYETGKDTFKAITGIDPAGLTFKDGVHDTFLSTSITEEMMDQIRTQMTANVCYTLVTDKKGEAETKADSLPVGTYLVLEKTPSAGYLNSTIRGGETAKIIKISEDGEVVSLNYDATDLEKSLYEPVIRGGFEVYKYDEETKMNVPLGSADLSASFEVINRSKDYVWVDTNENGTFEDDECYAPGAVVFTFTTDKKTGRYTSKADLLPYGTYEIHETYPPYGYLHLSNINPNLSIFFEIREEGKIVDEGWYYDKDGKKVTSHTHYAPILDAYDEDGVKIPNEEIVGERKEVTDARLIIYNFVVRGDLYFEKKSAVDMKKMAYIPFLMTSYDENGNAIESHIIFTDQNGNYNSSTLYVDHTYETNAGDEMYDWLTAYNEAYDNEDTETLKKLDEEYKTLVTKYKKGVGTWFGLNTKVSDDLGRHGTLDQSLNATGALPFGTYTIEELRCPNNKDYELVSDTIILDTDAAETDAATDPEGYKSHSMHGTINFGTIYNRKDKLGISTVALTQDEESHYSHAYSDLVIVDSVTYNNVIPGNSYKMVAELHDVATGDILYDDWGEEIRVTKEFTPKLATDILKMNLTFDAYDYKDGGSVVVYEYLYEIVDGKENLVAKEANASTKDQQIHFPSLASELTDEKTGEHMIGVEDDTEYTLVDLITFKNLEIGETYVVDGYLIDKNETDYLKADGSYIKADVYDKDDTRFAHNKEGNIIFKPDTNDGTFKLVYKVKGKDVKGKTAVSFVNVEKNRNSITKHMEITDEKQTMYFPDVHTTVYDKETGIPMSFADDKITVVDTVAYESLLPKQTYELLGTLVNKETGKTVTDKSGKEVTAKATFVPETSSGTTDVVFEFDGTGLDGTTLVAFEALYLGSTKLVDHNDINDSDETFYIGKIKTKARNAENGTQLANPDGSITITDTVIYENLIPERYYKLVGKILDESTGKVLLDKNGKEITASATFKPEKANGETDVTFTFTGYEELKGKKAVCVETLYVDVIKDAKTEKATTTDADGTDEVSDKDSDFRIVAKEDTMPNEDQTIYFPDLHTTAYDATVGINMTKADKAKVIDRVEYENLIPGLTYEVKGTIIDKATEKTVEVNGKDVTASATFTPDKTSGSVDVVFEFDATDLAGKTLVAYEDLYIESSLIKQHRYIDDEAETFYIPKIGTEAKDAENSTHVGEAKENASIIDTISYENLIAGREYLAVGQLINKSNETAVLLKDGVEFNSETGECVSGPGHYQIMSFTPEKKNGTVDMTFNFDATGLAGSSVVVYEEIYVKIDNKLYLVADHKDLSNTSQTIDYPGVTTTAKNKADDTHYAKPEKITIVDAVNYTNLEVGKTYTVTGTLMSRKTGKAITKKDKSGKSVPITSTVTFEAEKKNGTIDLEFTVDATDLAGDTVVCFERVYWNKIQVASHTDINDESQSVHVVSIGTTALDSSTKEHITKNGKTVIVDTVKYEGLIPNTEYVISGKLMDKATGKSLKKGTKASKIKTLVNKVSGKSNEYISEIKFTPTTADGSVDIKFEVDTSDLSGKTLVCYEAVYENNKKIASHEDINSEEQAVYVPHISTKLVDKLTKTKNTVYSNKTVLVDTISYENLIPNITYTISGKLIDKETGKEIAIANSTNKDKKNMVTITFTPKKSNGTVDAEFVIDTTNLSGKTLVCYEYLYVNNVEIAKHEDKNSEDQSAYTIEIGTKATVDGKKTAKKSEKTVVVDTISCKNLIVGQEYIMKGELIDKATKKSTGITSTVTFKANKANATVKMEFTVDTTKYDSLVAYEELYIKDKLVAQHKDINSKDQTVTFTKDTPPDKVKTGGGILLFLLIVMTLGSGVYGIYNIRRKRRYLK